ncbi:hypothetical protein TGARI_371600, partial [Toxoplasma gondii ARI]
MDPLEVEFFISEAMK